MRQILAYLALAGAASAYPLNQHNADNDFSLNFNDFFNDEDFQALQNWSNQFEEKFGDFGLEPDFAPEQAPSVGA